MSKGSGVNSERLPNRGGNWTNAGNAGLAALNLNNTRGNSNTNRGFRLRFRPLTSQKLCRYGDSSSAWSKGCRILAARRKNISSRRVVPNWEACRLRPQESHSAWAARIIEQRRLCAYANPETGSDRHFAEASRLEAEGLTGEAQMARSAGLARYAEIKSMYPWPDA